MPHTPVESAIDKLIQQGIDLLQAGDIPAAREILSQAVLLEPHNEKAWLWRSGAVETDLERKLCLQHVLSINPDNEVARQGLEHLSQLPSEAAPDANGSDRRIKRLSIQPPASVVVPPPPAPAPVEAVPEPARKTYSNEMLYWPESHQPKRPVWLAVLLVVIIVVVGAYTILRSLHMIDPIMLPFAASAVLPLCIGPVYLSEK